MDTLFEADRRAFLQIFKMLAPSDTNPKIVDCAATAIEANFFGQRPFETKPLQDNVDAGMRHAQFQHYFAQVGRVMEALEKSTITQLKIMSEMTDHPDVTCDSIRAYASDMRASCGRLEVYFLNARVHGEDFDPNTAIRLARMKDPVRFAIALTARRAAAQTGAQPS